jgi:1-deoxy-D-xylulose-5-phosphate reductoisomerase
LKRVVILGSTGSIGRSAVEIIDSASDDFDVVGLSCGENIVELERQLARYSDSRFTVKDSSLLSKLLLGNDVLKGREVGYGRDGLVALIEETEPDIVVNALVGVVGLVPTVTALSRGCRVALANKETLVTGGEIIDAMAGDPGDLIIPVDSEHFSLSRCLKGYRGNSDEIVLTASGGPFYDREIDSLESVSVEEVLDHPTWTMGRKVTVDSAHLFNKGLEVIEAYWLFKFPYDKIKVVIHPQSIVHSLVRLKDGSFMANLAAADMRLPIMSALYAPEIREFPWRSLRVDELTSLEFIPLEPKRFPAFELAVEAGETGGTAPAVLNAADELAVDAFLAGRIGFLEIVKWIEEALNAHRPEPVEDVADVLDADRWTREYLADRHGEASPM